MGIRKGYDPSRDGEKMDALLASLRRMRKEREALGEFAPDARAIKRLLDAAGVPVGPPAEVVERAKAIGSKR